MQNSVYQFDGGKVIIRLRGRICETPDELLTSELFLLVLKRALRELTRRESKLLTIFLNPSFSEENMDLLVHTLQYLVKLPSDMVMRVLPESTPLFRDRLLFNDFIEFLYNYWRSQQRFIVCEQEGESLDKRPYRTFTDTVERLTHLVRGIYRDVQENIVGTHPRIYRQVRSGADVAAIALPKQIPLPGKGYTQLNPISLIRQVLIYPPLIFSPPMNKRSGMFERVFYNPLDRMDLNKEDYVCYPAKVGPLVMMIYFHIHFFELGFSLCNLFDLADDTDLQRQPDAVYIYGAPDSAFEDIKKAPTIFYDDEENDMLVGAVPAGDVFGYFGYLKKMILTLHNIRMMKLGRLPFHGAMFNIDIQGKRPHTILVMGDSGAGKSEMIDALQSIAGDELKDLLIIADDMGSLDIEPQGRVVGYGTETGAFVRLDDLQPGYAFGQIDRTIIMNASQVNARVILPVTTFDHLIRGYTIDYVLYANNYETVSGQNRVIERFYNQTEALDVFRKGTVMSKGTTTSQGLVGTYFANIFGPPQYKELHETLAERYFTKFFANNLFVGQLRTQLGIPGMERQGPWEAAKALLTHIKEFDDGRVS
ncbi:MAG: phosphoenolpyruvate carboxykinase [Anaerolineaceae bacterium]|nr:phosphoenolpyruvate carboxykinase [Anaerolineaceae bacterium]